MYPQWSSNVDTPPQYVKPEENPPELQSADSVNQTNTERKIKSEIVNSEESVPTHAVTKEKPNFTLAMSPQATAVEVYPQVMPILPGKWHIFEMHFKRHFLIPACYIFIFLP